MRHSEGCSSLTYARRHLAILPSRASRFLAPERIRRPFHLGGGLDLLGQAAIRGFCIPIQWC